jgi:Icc protein
MNQGTRHFAIVTDTHIVEPGGDLKGHGTNEAAIELVRMLNEEPVPLSGVVFLGDLSDTVNNPDRYKAVATESSYGNGLEILSDLRLPRLHIPGNHDDPRLLAEIHPSSWQSSRDGVSVARVNDVDFIAIDARTGPEPTGYLRPETIKALDQALHESRRAVLLSHYPLVDFDSSVINDQLSTINRHELIPLFHRYREKILGTFHGHLHLWSSTLNHAVPTLSVPSASFAFNWDPDKTSPHPTSMQPRGYVVVSVTTDGSIVVRSRFLPQRKDLC